MWSTITIASSITRHNFHLQWYPIQKQNNDYYIISLMHETAKKGLEIIIRMTLVEQKKIGKSTSKKCILWSKKRKNFSLEKGRESKTRSPLTNVSTILWTIKQNFIRKLYQLEFSLKFFTQKFYQINWQNNIFFSPKQSHHPFTPKS